MHYINRYVKKVRTYMHKPKDFVLLKKKSLNFFLQCRLEVCGTEYGLSRSGFRGI
jgi:hypothetical protein